MFFEHELGRNAGHILNRFGIAEPVMRGKLVSDLVYQELQSGSRERPGPYRFVRDREG